MEQQTFVNMQNISKAFGTVIANKNINLSVYKGEVHALLGENGAGKSTLMNMLSGIYVPDSGSISIHGQEVIFRSPKEAISMGIGMIHQHFKLVDVLSAAENIMAGQKNSIFIHKNKLRKKILEICSQYGMNVDPDKLVYQMSVGEKQTIEILKVLYRGADILILDEPTAVLTPQETERLFEIIKKMKAMGCAIIIITHKLQEVMEISDRITVLRKGETVATVNKEDTTSKQLTELMVGKSVDLAIERVKSNTSPPILKAKNLTVTNDDGAIILDKIEFDLCPGEILGIAGVAGSGQKELCEAIVGLQSIDEGTITYCQENLVGQSPREIIKKGISMSFIPEDRLGMGLVASMDMVDNLILKEYKNQKGLFVDRNPAKVQAKEMIEKLDIKTPGIHHPVKQLSGGNIQKVLLGRELESNPKVLITAYPVRGLDIGAAHMIYDLINEQKRKNVAILFVGEDLDVLRELCDRIMVLCDGKITGIVKADKATKEEIGFLMAGERFFLEKEGEMVDETNKTNEYNS